MTIIESSRSTTENTLSQLVKGALRKSPHLAGRGVEHEAAQGHVVLRGVVNSYYQKLMAQEIVRRLDGVQSVENHLEVNWK